MGKSGTFRVGAGGEVAVRTLDLFYSV